MQNRLVLLILAREKEEVAEVVGEKDFTLAVLASNKNPGLGGRPLPILINKEKKHETVELPRVQADTANLEKPVNIGRTT